MNGGLRFADPPYELRAGEGNEDDMERSNVSMIALAWFRPEEWHELKRICPDLQDTYKEWLANAHSGLEALGGPLNDQVVKSS